MADDDGIEMYGEIKQKLIRRKQEWARDGRLLTGNQAMEDRTQRLPPGQRLTKDWPVLDLGVQPDVPLDKWKLVVDGLVEKPLEWRWQDFAWESTWAPIPLGGACSH